MAGLHCLGTELHCSESVELQCSDTAGLHCPHIAELDWSDIAGLHCPHSAELHCSDNIGPHPAVGARDYTGGKNGDAPSHYDHYHAHGHITP